jgi:trehalose 6-phosphate phosphatase
VLFLGDDAGDIPAFEQVRELRAAGVTAWGVGVCSTGVDGIREAADVTVDDPVAVVDILRLLLD